jgi:hypothetical protein
MGRQIVTEDDAFRYRQAREADRQNGPSFGVASGVAAATAPGDGEEPKLDSYEDSSLSSSNLSRHAFSRERRFLRPPGEIAADMHCQTVLQTVVHGHTALSCSWVNVTDPLGWKVGYAYN